MTSSVFLVRIGDRDGKKFKSCVRPGVRDDRASPCAAKRVEQRRFADVAAPARGGLPEDQGGPQGAGGAFRKAALTILHDDPRIFYSGARTFAAFRTAESMRRTKASADYGGIHRPRRVPRPAGSGQLDRTSQVAKAVMVNAAKMSCWQAVERRALSLGPIWRGGSAARTAALGAPGTAQLAERLRRVKR